MIRRLPLALLAPLFAGAASPALAKDVLSSSYWDAAYLAQELEGDGSSATIEAEGYRLGLNLGVMKFLNFAADYEQVRDHGNRDGYGSAGFAYHTQNPEYQFFGGLSYERTEGKSSNSEEGYGVEVGGRYMLDNVELHASYKYIDYGKVDGTEADFTGARYVIGADLQLSAWWSLTADYRGRELEVDAGGASAQADYTGYSVGLRRYFVSSTDRRARHGGVLAPAFGSLFGGGDEEEAAE